MTHRKPAFLNDPETLSDAEKELIAACAEGEPCILGQKRPEPNDTTAPTIRAELIRFLALGGDNDHPVDPFGIDLRGARVEGELDLAFCQILRLLMLFNCEVREPVILVDAGLPLLNLSGSRLSGTDEDGDSLLADGVQVAGSVFLRAGFEAHGTVRLLGAELGGNLDCMGGKFRASHVALYADGLKTRGSVFLRDRFEAHGTVRLLDAEVGGSLECEGGTFRASDVALQLQAAQVDGVFLFRDLSERPKGAVDLTGAHVGMLVDDAESWPERGKLVLDGFTYKRFAGDAPTNAAMRMTWLEKQSEADLTVDFRPQPFEQVAKVLREMGHAEDAKRIAMAKQRRARTAQWMQAYERLSKFRMMRRTEIDAARIKALDREIWKAWWRRLGRPVALLGHIGRAALSWTFGLVIGYGYRPVRALVGAALFITFGFWMFHSAEVAREMVPNNPFLLKQEWKEAREEPDPYTAFAEVVPDFQPLSPVTYAIDTFVPLVNLHQEPHWIPKGGTWARLYLNIHIAMGWLITTLFVASLTGIVKKD